MGTRPLSRQRGLAGLNLPGMKVTAPFLDGGGKFVQECAGLGPVDAGVGDALSIDECLAVCESLTSGDEIAFHHDPDDAALAVRDLLSHGAAYGALPAMVFAAVGVATVDHDTRTDAGLLHLLDGRGDGSCIIVRGLPPATQDDVAVRIAGGKKDGGLSRLRRAEEGVRMAGGEDGFDRDLHVAGGAVLESDRAG